MTQPHRSSTPLARRFDSVVDCRHMADLWLHLRRLAEQEVERTFASLPGVLRERARALPVTMERMPNAALVADGVAPDTLGLFTGAGHAEEEQIPMPPQIILFLQNLWDLAAKLVPNTLK